jgi:hypothetical protein
MKRSPGTSTRTRPTLPLGVTCRCGKDEIKKLIINYKKEGLKMH